MTSAVASQSRESKSPLPHTISPPGPMPHTAVLNAYSVNVYPQIASFHWPIEHFALHIQPQPEVTHAATLTHRFDNHSPGLRKRALDDSSIGQSCVDSRTKHTTKRKKLSDQERDSARRVRAQGSCLRCYVQRLKCSEGRPCDGCQTLFNKAHGSRMLEWTACVSSKLSDINIFTLGISLSDDRKFDPTKVEDKEKMGTNAANSLYAFGVEIASSSSLPFDFDSLYFVVLEHIYGQRALEVHPFILRDQNPLYMLIKLNVILLGSPILGPKIVGRIRFLQMLRAACAVVAFQGLEKAFERNTLAASSLTRQLALIVQAALLLDQVIEMNANASGFAVCFAQGKDYMEMNQHLIQYISHYLRILMSRVFGKSCSFITYVQKAKSGDVLGEVFWDNLAEFIPIMPLGKPPRVRGYTDTTFKSCASEVNLEHIYRTMYT